MTLYTTSDELLPCPFCQESAARMYPPTCTKLTRYNSADRAFPVVRCRCGVEKAGNDWDQSGRSAIEAWNSRASSSTVQQVGAEWISTSERLPELGQSVALINVDRWENTGGDLEMNVRACGYLHEMRPGDPYWSIRGERANCLDAFTHWLPLPSPKSEQGDQQ